jgi:hypothetical protein
VLRVIEAYGRPVDFAQLTYVSRKDKIPANATIYTVEMKRFILDTKSKKYEAKLNDIVANGSVKISKNKLLKGGLGAIVRGWTADVKGRGSRWREAHCIDTSNTIINDTLISDSLCI